MSMHTRHYHQDLPLLRHQNPKIMASLRFLSFGPGLAGSLVLEFHPTHRQNH